MKYLSYLLIFLSSNSVNGQYESREIETEDINMDGTIDTVSIWSDHGSGYGGRECTITNGKTGENHTLGIWGSFGQIRHTLAVPESILSKENEPFLIRLKDELLYDIKNEPDPSLQWIIDANLHHSKINDDSLFDLKIEPKTPWTRGAPLVPSSYSVQIDQASFNKLYFSDGPKPDWYDSTSTNGFISYSARNHLNPNYFRKTKPEIDSSGFTHAQKNATYEILTTSHGIVVKKGNKYKWLFVNDMNLTSGPEKLRWTSIGDVQLVDRYLIVQHMLAPGRYNQFIVIDMETNKCGFLKQGGVNFRIEKDIMVIKTDEEVTYVDEKETVKDIYASISLRELLSEFTKL